jgi:hypothetical protein
LQSDAERKIQYLSEVIEIPMKIERYMNLHPSAASALNAVSDLGSLVKTGFQNQKGSSQPCSPSTSEVLPPWVLMKTSGDAMDLVDPGFRGQRCLTDLKNLYLEIRSAREAKTIKAAIFDARIGNLRTPQEILDFYLWLEKYDYPIPETGATETNWVGRHISGAGAGAIRATKMLIDCISDSSQKYATTARRVIFDHGKACNSVFKDVSREPHVIGDGEYIYVVDRNGELYVRELGSGFHPTITREFEVSCAGHIHFRDGKISEIDNQSGHYMPTAANLEAAVNILKSKNGIEIFKEDFVMKTVAKK